MLNKNLIPILTKKKQHKMADLLVRNNVVILPCMVLLILIGATNSKSQAQNAAYETVFTHINRNIFLNGSQLNYASYISNAEASSASTIIYYSLLNGNDSCVLSWKQEAKDQSVSGNIAIPESIANGSYYLVSYTNTMRNYPAQALHKIPIGIQKIYEAPSDSLNSSFTTPWNENSTRRNANEELLSVVFTKQNQVQVSIKAPSKVNSAKLSVAFTELSPYNQNGNFNVYDAYALQAQNILNNNRVDALAVENNYAILSGKIVHHNSTTPLSNEVIYLAYKDSTLHFDYFKTTQDGAFCFFLDSSYNDKTIYLQTAINENVKDSMDWIINSKALTYKQTTKNVYDSLNFASKSYVNLLQKRELIHRVYNNETKESWVADTITKANFFEEADYIVKPSDYYDLNDFQDIVENILPSVRIKSENNVIKLGMVIDQQIMYDNVLVSINGVPCFNMAYVNALTSKDIKQIELYNKVLMHGDLTFNGVIAIYTQPFTISNDHFCSQHYCYDHNFKHTGKPQNRVSSKEKNPLVNPDVFWQAEMELSKDNPLIIPLPQPEIGKHYQLIINGIVNNNTPFSFFKTIDIETNL